MRQIHELQTLETRVLVRDKALKAFDKLRLPTFVEHASLQMKCLGGMPGALTQLFWDKLEHKLCDIVKCLGNDEAFATSTIDILAAHDGSSGTLFLCQKARC
jgi:XTP/dITP diphosphohydrolase